MACDPESYATVCEAVAAFDGRDRLPAITAPTLVVTGDGDPTCPPEVTAVLRDGIPGAAHVLVEHSAHLANICRPDAFGAAVRAHLEAHAAAS